MFGILYQAKLTILGDNFGTVPQMGLYSPERLQSEVANELPLLRGLFCKAHLYARSGNIPEDIINRISNFLETRNPSPEIILQAAGPADLSLILDLLPSHHPLKNLSAFEQDENLPFQIEELIRKGLAQLTNNFSIVF